MRKAAFFDHETKRRQTVLLACGRDASLLDLLCEDGFLERSELPEVDSAAVQLMLLQRAIRRGFLLESCHADAVLDMLAVKKLDSLRAWTNLVDEDVHLRAPPRCA